MAKLFRNNVLIITKIQYYEKKTYSENSKQPNFRLDNYSHVGKYNIYDRKIYSSQYVKYGSVFTYFSKFYSKLQIIILWKQ